jgi:hypothetical protein
MPALDSGRSRLWLIRAALWFGGAALVGFHAVLLGRRLAGPAAFDALSLLRWVGALAILGALVGPRGRAGRLDARRAGALALAALLLHAPALHGPQEQALSVAFLAALPPLVWPVIVLLALGGARHDAGSGPKQVGPSAPLEARWLAPAFLAVVGPRPPPASS